MGIDKRWLPAGYHYDLHIERDRSAGNGAGPFTGGGWKLLWHITVSPWGMVDQMVKVLHDKRAEPHFVIGGRKGLKHPVLIQLLPLDVAGKSLQNDPSDGRQTNRANVIQVEICATPGRRSDARLFAGVDERDAWLTEHGTDLFALDGTMLTDMAMRNAGLRDTPDDWSLCMPEPIDDPGNGFGERDRILASAFRSGVASWTDDTYKALGNLTELVEHRVPVPRKLARSFQVTKRFTDREFEKAAGHCGHMHGPDDNHIDPTSDFQGKKLLHYASSAPNQL